MKRVVVDPISRIEGHLRVEIKVDEASGKVEDALSSGTAWRGIELVAKDRDPRDLWAFVQRICGVCTTTHALAALRAVEDALGITIPKNANYIRNIMHSSLDVHDHIVHFYHLHALDWVSPVAALSADPAKTAQLQNDVLATYNVSGLAPAETASKDSAYPKEFPKATAAYFTAVQQKVKKIVESGQLGIFSAQWWDHPDYNVLPPEVHLMAVSHYLNILDRQRDIVIPHVVFGGKNPHPHYIVGGMPCSISMNDMNAPINTQRLAAVEQSIALAKDLVSNFYLPDLLAIGKIYVEKGMIDGGGLAKKRVMSYGDYPDDTYTGISNGDYHKKCIVRSNGVVENFALGVDKATFIPLEGKDFMDPQYLSEEVEHSWFTYPNGTNTLHPLEGVTDPKFTGPKSGTKEKWEFLDEDKKYSWIKSPTFKGKTAEVGPLAKYIVVYTKVKQGIIKDPTWAESMIVRQIDTVSQVLGVPAHVWMTTMVGRTACRGLDAQVAANMSQYFFDKLVANIKNGDTTVADTTKFEPNTWDKDAKGVGLVDAPRGGLGHWIHIKDGRSANYQCIVPSTWNACPKTAANEHGAYEDSMIDTKVKQGIIKDPTWAESMIVRQIDTVSQVLGVPAHVWMTTMVGRTACRGLDAQVASNISQYYFDKLVENIKNGDTTVADMTKFEPNTWDKDAKGVGLVDAPRGGLGHWIHIKDGRSANYQCIVPSTWNACPKTAANEHGAYEDAMIDTHVKIADKPLEILKVIHSFDPCLACATHLYNKKGEKIVSVNTDALCK